MSGKHWTAAHISLVGDIDERTLVERFFRRLTQKATHRDYGAFKVKNGYLNFDAGTIVLGSTDHAGLSFPHPNGTLYYCTNCQQTSTCSSGGSGAIAKKIAGAWKCN